MSVLFKFFSSYFLASWTYWVSYILIRSKVKGKHKARFLLSLNLLLGLMLVTVIPFYLKLSGWISSTLILVLGSVMGLSAVLHHVATLIDLQPWNGVVTPKGLDVAVIHGTVSHLLFSMAYSIYGFILLLYYFGQTVLLSEKMILFTFVTSIELVAFIVAFDGVRMATENKHDY